MGLWPRFRRETKPPARRRGPPPSKVQPRAAAGDRISDPLDVRAGGHLLRAVMIGPGPKYAPSVVFLHEGLGCIALWRDLPLAIARAAGCNALIYERIGHGGSDPAPAPRRADYFEHEAETVLPDVLDFFGIDEAVLIGHSDGGTIALLAAAALPERVRGVVAIAAHSYLEPAALAGIERTRARYATDTGFRARLKRYHGPNAAPLVEAWSSFWLAEGFRDWSIEARLAAVRAPVLLIQGEADDYATPAQLARTEAALGGPVQSLLLAGAGHTPQREAADAVSAAITKFLRELPAD